MCRARRRRRRQRNTVTTRRRERANGNLSLERPARGPIKTRTEKLPRPARVSEPRARGARALGLLREGGAAIAPLPFLPFLRRSSAPRQPTRASKRAPSPARSYPFFFFSRPHATGKAVPLSGNGEECRAAAARTKLTKKWPWPTKGGGCRGRELLARLSGTRGRSWPERRCWR